jgi:light-regulated signal transduction histidine kinase (bacteriophytochrome)
MSALVKALLDFSRLGRDKKLAYVDCNKIVQDTMADLADTINSSGAIIQVGEMPSLNAYETEIHQLFQNLISNAIKFRKKNTQPEIQIHSEKLIDKWKVSVRDNGIGIAPNHFDRIFHIFQRLHKAEEYEGYGVGLPNCKKIVELHGGEIWVESVLGEGTTFHFTISNLK